MRLLLSCEHAGHRVPSSWKRLFEGPLAKEALESHRGLDIGALVIARALSRRLEAPLVSHGVTRLLADVNRSLGHPELFSEFSRPLPPSRRQQILNRYYHPHRDRIASAVENAAGPVIHIGIHSFTPRLHGVVRRADIGLLYDPSRPGERRFCRTWQARLVSEAPHLTIRRNYPYRGTADGLTTWLRRRFDHRIYTGIELEINQALLSSRRSSESAAILLSETLAGALTRGTG